VKTQVRRQSLLTPVTPKAEPPLSPTRAFAARFRVETGVVRKRFTGRVEHLVSGRATRFH
jgi:hypothetical protein